MNALNRCERCIRNTIVSLRSLISVLELTSQEYGSHLQELPANAICAHHSSQQTPGETTQLTIKKILFEAAMQPERDEEPFNSPSSIGSVSANSTPPSHNRTSLENDSSMAGRRLADLFNDDDKQINVDAEMAASAGVQEAGKRGRGAEAEAADVQSSDDTTPEATEPEDNETEGPAPKKARNSKENEPAAAVEVPAVESPKVMADGERGAKLQSAVVAEAAAGESSGDSTAEVGEVEQVETEAPARKMPAKRRGRKPKRKRVSTNKGKAAEAKENEDEATVEQPIVLIPKLVLRRGRPSKKQT